MGWYLGSKSNKLQSMSYRYPQYPSENTYTPRTWDKRWESQHQESSHYQKTNAFRVDTSRSINQGMDNQRDKNQQIEEIRHPQTYEQVLQETLYNETCRNIQAMIHSNNQAIDKLQQTNLMLHQHLENLKQIFKLKRDNQKNSEKNFQPSAYQTLNTQSFYEEKKLEEQMVKKEEAASKRLNRTYHPSKGPVRYTKQSWVTEQYYVQQFLQSFLKDNIKVTPSQPSNIIGKSKILQLYLKWRKLRNLNGNQLEDFKVQQIITNEMKVVFGCTITMKDYVGLIFKDIQDSRETKDVKQSKIKDRNQQKQTQKSKLKEKKNINSNAILSEGEEKIDEQFSLGSQDGEFKIEDLSEMYS